MRVAYGGDAASALAAWLITGPLGHLYSAVADLGVFGVRSLRTRVRGRVGGDR